MTRATPPSLASLHIDELRREADAEHLARQARRNAGANPPTPRLSLFVVWMSRIQAGLLR